MHDRRPAIRWRAQSSRAGIDRPATVARAGPQALPRGAASRPGAHPRRGVLARRVGSLTYQVSADGDKFATVVTTVERSGHTVNAEFRAFHLPWRRPPMRRWTMLVVAPGFDLVHLVAAGGRRLGVSARTRW